MAYPHPQGPSQSAADKAERARGLYDPEQERDACGVAFVADLHGRRSHDVVAKGLSALIRLDHRGARGAEQNTGDAELIGVTAGGVDAVLAEGLQHHLFLGRVLGKVRM